MKISKTKLYISFACFLLRYGCFLLFLILSFILTSKHEPWIDEIYAWQISKFSLYDIFYEMRYEGHFVLWYYILYPFSHIRLPLSTLGFISWFLNALAIFYLLWKSPFVLWAKVLILITLPFLYLNPAISRCYVLIPLLIFPLANHLSKILNKSDEENNNRHCINCAILLALLANTHVYVEGFVCITSLTLLCKTFTEWKTLKSFQKKIRILAFSIIVIGVMFAFLTIIPSLYYSSVFLDADNKTGNIIEFLSAVYITSKIRIALTLLLLLTSLILLFIKNTQIGTIFLISCLSMIVICVFVYAARVPARAVIWFYYLLFCLWIISDTNNPSGLWYKNTKLLSSIIIAILSLLLYNPAQAKFDYYNYYSEESVLAKFITNNIDSSTIIYSNPNEMCCAIMEYLPHYTFKNIKDMSTLYPRADRQPIVSAMAKNYIDNIFLSNPKCDFIYLLDCVIDKSNYMERFKVPYEYELLYPMDDKYKWYFLKFYFLKVKRPSRLKRN